MRLAGLLRSHLRLAAARAHESRMQKVRLLSQIRFTDKAGQHH